VFGIECLIFSFVRLTASTPKLNTKHSHQSEGIPIAKIPKVLAPPDCLLPVDFHSVFVPLACQGTGHSFF
jgi:hypothetical protein